MFIHVFHHHTLQHSSCRRLKFNYSCVTGGNYRERLKYDYYYLLGPPGTLLVGICELTRVFTVADRDSTSSVEYCTISTKCSQGVTRHLRCQVGFCTHLKNKFEANSGSPFGNCWRSIRG
jgi:hypothetical protein